MSVFRTLELKWKGEAFDWTPNLDVLRKMDAALRDEDGAQRTDITRIANACMHGGVNLPDLAVCWSIALRSAGQDVSPDDCYGALMEAKDMADIINFQARMYEAVYPQIDLGKNLKAPSQSKPKATGPRKRATTGRTSTSARAKTSA
jgi:hypothetical protein